MKRTLPSPLTLLLLSLAASPLPAQVVIPLSPRDTYYLTNGDPLATDAFALPIFALGVRPGDYLRVRCLGDWDNGVNGDSMRDLVGVFAGSGTLQPATVQQRLTAAVAAGTAFQWNGGTAVGNLSMEIGEDFWVSRNGFGSEILLRVPAGGSDLFFCVPDAFYSDNGDPDADFAVELSLEPGPHYGGTNEDIELGSSVGALPLDTFDVKSGTAGDVVNLAIRSPLGTQAGFAYALFLDAALTSSGPPSTAVPWVWLGASFTELGIGLVPSGAPSGTLSLPVPAGFAGFSAWVQGGTVHPLARNGLYLATDAHEIRLQ